MTNKPGQTAKTSGQYAMLDKNGKKLGIERTVVNGGKFPPTKKPGQSYKLVDRTKTR